jgi:taurine dioxygenase
LDLRVPLSKGELGQVLAAIGHYGVLCFPGQTLNPREQAAFTEQFGELHEARGNHPNGETGVSILSNIVEDGRNIGNPDAGLIWHRDMTYYPVAGFANVLYALTVPRRDGRPLGSTQLINTAAACDDLPGDVKARLAGAVGCHDFERYNRLAREAGSKRKSYAEQEVTSAPMTHPILFQHPITGKQVLYCDPSQVGLIEGLPDGEDSDAMLRFLVGHELQPKYQKSFTWTEGDVLMWDNLSTLHRVIIDYTIDEPRLMHRCQAMGNKIFDPAFIKPALAEAKAAA